MSGHVRAAVKIPQTKGLKQQRFIISGLWRLEGGDQGVSGAVFPLKMPEEDLFQAFLPASDSSLVCGVLTPSSHRVLPE